MIEEMAAFGIRFFFCNLLLAAVIGGVFAAKWLFRRRLSARMQYQLWFPVGFLLAAPFFPSRMAGMGQLLTWLGDHLPFLPFGSGAERLLAWFRGLFLNPSPGVGAGAAARGAAVWTAGVLPQDFGLSAAEQAPPAAGIFVSAVWLAGILFWLAVSACSAWRFLRLKNAALPVKSRAVQALYEKCLEECGIRRKIPLCSTAFLKSPVMAGFLFPRIYIPAGLPGEYRGERLRYMLLHELQHYRHGDGLVNHVLVGIGVLYWFNPAVRCALRRIRTEREIACDASVLGLLDPSEYGAYGHTLIDFAEKLTWPAVSFGAGIGGDAAQLERRIRHIAGYRRQTAAQRAAGVFLCFFLTALLLNFSPVLSARAGSRRYEFSPRGESVVYLDLSQQFAGFGGSFVLYDEGAKTWRIYGEETSLERIAPDSTYKIYSALLGLEAGIIRPEESLLSWDGTACPLASWEQDLDLNTAMALSANWYFQRIDEAAGAGRIGSFLEEIDYGNRQCGRDTATYWGDGSLAISPVEQVLQLRRFYHNEYAFSDENVEAVKKAIRLSATSQGILSGKTGTGQAEGEDVNGWFTGYLEQGANVYYFCTNLQAASGASGSRAAELTGELLEKVLFSGGGEEGESFLR